MKVGWRVLWWLTVFFGLFVVAACSSDTDLRDYSPLPEMQIEGELAPGNTVKASQGDLKLPQECDVASFEWSVTHGESMTDYSATGDSLLITPLMAGAELTLILNSAGKCGDKRYPHYSERWLIPVNTEERITNLTPPRLSGELRPGGVVQIVPGTWQPSGVDVVYVCSRFMPDEIIALRYALAGRCEYCACSDEAPVLTLDQEPTQSLYVWAVVSYSNYQPLAHFVQEVSFE